MKKEGGLFVLIPVLLRIPSIDNALLCQQDLAGHTGEWEGIFCPS
jgi:hypothetical protein